MQSAGTLLYTLDVEGDTATEITLTLDDCNSGSSTLYCDEVWELTDKDITWAMVYDLESDEANCEGTYTMTVNCTTIGASPSGTGSGVDYFAFESVNSPNIIVIDNVDFELYREHNLTLMVDDRDGRHFTTEMDVFIVDEDDMTPVFTDVIYESEVYENVEHIVLEVTPKIQAYDQDFGINETVYYSFAGEYQ
ncbi:protocadherin alpha-9-like [Ptychodera flava]|uniref:protocadherin alpha-9-like n=1 Tax=Ptychodera flava TaxID=63121 RepID=UPI00396A0142